MTSSPSSLANKNPKEENKQHLIAVAGPLFAERGYDSVSIRDIAEAAEVNVAAVNYYFGGKDGLYEAIFDTIHAKGQNIFPEPDFTDQADFTTFLEAYLTHVFSHMSAQHHETWPQILLRREMLYPTASLAPLLQKMRAVAQHDFQKIELIFSHFVKPSFPAERRKLYVMTVISQVLFYSFNESVIQSLRSSSLSTAALFAAHIARTTGTALIVEGALTA